ncbi:MAG: YhdP family protein, partial [Alcaligenes aquatilis]
PAEPEVWQGPVRWLLEQRGIHIQGTSLQWQDDLRGAPALNLPSIQLQIGYRQGWHEVSLATALPADLGESLALTLRVQGKRRLPVNVDVMDLPWEMTVQAKGVDTPALRPWLDVPVVLDRGWIDVRAQARQPKAAQAVQMQLAAQLQDVAVLTDSEDRLQLEQAHLELNGSLRDVQALAQGKQSGDVQWTLSMNGFGLRVPDLFAHYLALDQLNAQGMVHRDEQARLSLSDMNLALRNPDLDAQLTGSWREDAKFEAGVADWQGQFTHLNLAALVNYLPLTVNPLAREWMQAGLVQGAVRDGTIRLQGGLDTFPYGLSPADGSFEVVGMLGEGIVDYQPAQSQRLAWPRLEGVQGSIRMHNDNLDIEAQQARMPIAKQPDIVLRDIQTRITSLEQNSFLTLEGVSQAPATSYLALVHQSPLNALLDGLLADSRVKGDWTVPIKLQVPLDNADDTQVQGQIQMNNSEFQYMPEAPSLTALKGELAFSEKGVSAQTLTGKVLGGDTQISGVLEPGKPGLRLNGVITAQGLEQYLELKGVQRLQGQTPYQVLMKLDAKGSFSFGAESDLTGLALNLPEPFYKPAERAAKLKADWSSDSAAKMDRLQISLQDRQTFLLNLLHAQGSRQGSYFQSGSMGTPGLVSWPKRGLELHSRYDRMDLDAWERVVEEFGQNLDGSPLIPSGRPLLPLLERVRLKADQAFFRGQVLDQLEMESTEDAAGSLFLSLKAKQAEGRLQAQHQGGRYTGMFNANFSHLYLNGGRPDWAWPDADLPMSDDLVLPAISFKVDDLQIQGVRFGALEAKGKPAGTGHKWTLENVSLNAQGMQLHGYGSLALSGPQRGLELLANSQVSNLGQFVDVSGLLTESIKDGEGTVQAALFWSNFPWSFDKRNIRGQFNVDLRKGRFISLKSRSAKLLELLSLQSISRLSRLDMDLFGAVKQGFAFDSLTGRMNLSQGKLELDNYQIKGPAGAVNLEGWIDIKDETLDLIAVVNPNLDMSGAAIAAYFTVNPMVGVGALLTQWLMQIPMSSHLSVSYAVTGKIDDPQLKELEVPAASTAKKEKQLRIEP